jgi:cobalt-zinc-cadmium efflux system outer membrane protein
LVGHLGGAEMRISLGDLRGVVWPLLMAIVPLVAGRQPLHAQIRPAEPWNAAPDVSSEPVPSPLRIARVQPAEKWQASSELLDGQAGLTSPATLAELESLALNHNPTLSQSAARITAAQGRYVQGGLYPNPSIGYVGDEIGNEGRGGQQGAFVGQRIITAKKLQLNRAAGAQEIAQAEWAWQAQQRRVVNDVRVAYYELLVARRAVELQDQLQSIGQQGVKSAEALEVAKEVSRTDVLQARVEAEAAAIQLQNARNRYQAAGRKLAAVVGVPDLDVRLLQGDLDADRDPRSWETALATLLAESPELAQAQAGVQRAHWALQRECAGRVPNIDAEASVKYDHATQNTVAGVTIGVPLPVFDRNQGNIRRAQAELIAAEQEVHRLELQLRDRLAAVFQRYENAQQQVERYSRNVLPVAKESLDLVTAGYRQGEFPYLTLLTAQRTYFRVSLTYLESLRELRASTVAIEGLLLSGALGPGGEGGTGTEPQPTGDSGVLWGISE